MYLKFSANFEHDIAIFDKSDFNLMILAENRNLTDAMKEEIDRLTTKHDLQFKIIDKGYGMISEELIGEAILIQSPLLTFNLEMPNYAPELLNKLCHYNYKMID